MSSYRCLSTPSCSNSIQVDTFHTRTSMNAIEGWEYWSLPGVFRRLGRSRLSLRSYKHAFSTRCLYFSMTTRRYTHSAFLLLDIRYHNLGLEKSSRDNNGDAQRGPRVLSKRYERCSRRPRFFCLTLTIQIFTYRTKTKSATNLSLWSLFESSMTDTVVY